MTNNLFELLHLVEGMHATACEQNGGVVYIVYPRSVALVLLARRPG